MKNLNRIHLSGLRAVEAVARLGSVKAAADELGVTVGAVSQGVRRGVRGRASPSQQTQIQLCPLRAAHQQMRWEQALMRSSSNVQ